VTRCSIRHNVLFRRYPENSDFDVEYCCNEEDKLEGLEWCALYRLFVDGLDDSSIVAGQAEMTPGPFFVPDDEGLEDCKHFLPVDVLSTMAGWNPEGK
jgi:hypothetical protein